MSGFSFDATIIVDALCGHPPAYRELQRATSGGGRAWISRLVWMEIMSRGETGVLKETEQFLSGFAVDEMDEEIAERAASLRRERPRLRSPDAIILATALTRGRVLVTRNIRDFPAQMPGIRIPYQLK
ncbi:MAG: PIN domain-containing protein [Blastomonas sp.]